MKEIAIAKVNNVNLLVSQDPEQLVPIKPICEALGIDIDAQRNRINRDEILSSVTVMTTATGSDGKQYMMVALPIKYVFGWLFTIDTSRVSEEARPAVIQYKLECYNALYEYFSGAQTFLKQKQEIIDKKTESYFEKQRRFKESRIDMMEAKRELQDILAVTYEGWLANSRQLCIPFECSNEEKEE